ncbi:MAG: MOSC domain-containing protein [Gemmatimonadota bacterium]|uniref:MOSC domain-containing protein n=1 Tax=Candidatus Palauibacter scopulicola TaxID=3056741 RepID=UPI00238CB196|nr:MOSC domain-containing protein [Candidatus Palauibacter scopulicola]MDE2661452.1 MOSC domain-containing protein [Candidatus Palauibacter scopulicola]
MSAHPAMDGAGAGAGAPRGMVVGRVVSLYRYPVKSMGGERLEAARITTRGMEGDRAGALVDRETGRVVSAKRPRLWGAVYGLSASFERENGGETGAASIRVRFEDGTTLSTLSSAGRGRLEARLSALLGREVAFATEAVGTPTCEYHWPDMEGLVQDGRTYRDEITEWELPPGTFFDSSGLHALTTASLDHLRGLVPGSDFDVGRFRPNLVIEPVAGAEGFVENDWVGGTLEVGGARLRVTKPCMRCVMVTLPLGDLPKDPRVLRAAFDHNEGNVGVKCEVAAPGAIRVGDEVRLG